MRQDVSEGEGKELGVVTVKKYGDIREVEETVRLVVMVTGWTHIEELVLSTIVSIVVY